ncbi:MAG: chorismate mutase, partial [Clostridia bacterium]|nr:chorismate mutase [Clostridia bacterium]
MSTENKKDLDTLREEISAINDELLDLFLKRMHVSAEIADYKKANDLPILDRAREREIFAEVEEKAGDLGTYAHRFFSNMMELSRAWQYSHIARETPLIDMIKESRLPADALF